MPTAGVNGGSLSSSSSSSSSASSSSSSSSGSAAAHPPFLSNAERRELNAQAREGKEGKEEKEGKSEVRPPQLAIKTRSQPPPRQPELTMWDNPLLRTPNSIPNSMDAGISSGGRDWFSSGGVSGANDSPNMFRQQNSEVVDSRSVNLLGRQVGREISSEEVRWREVRPEPLRDIQGNIIYELADEEQDLTQRALAAMAKRGEDAWVQNHMPEPDNPRNNRDEVEDLLHTFIQTRPLAMQPFLWRQSDGGAADAVQAIHWRAIQRHGAHLHPQPKPNEPITEENKYAGWWQSRYIQNRGEEFIDDRLPRALSEDGIPYMNTFRFAPDAKPHPIGLRRVPTNPFDVAEELRSRVHQFNSENQPKLKERTFREYLQLIAAQVREGDDAEMSMKQLIEHSQDDAYMERIKLDRNAIADDLLVPRVEPDNRDLTPTRTAMITRWVEDKLNDLTTMDQRARYQQRVGDVRPWIHSQLNDGRWDPQRLLIELRNRMEEGRGMEYANFAQERQDMLDRISKREEEFQLRQKNKRRIDPEHDSEREATKKHRKDDEDDDDTHDDGFNGGPNYLEVSPGVWIDLLNV